jgi:ankyrin repeat protein
VTSDTTFNLAQGLPAHANIMIKRPFQIAVFLSLLMTARAAAPDSPKIYEVLRSGSDDALRELVSGGVDVNYADAAGNTLLMQAAMYGTADSMKWLIRQGANVNATNKAGATALMRAAGDHDKIKLLVKSGANVNARSALLNSPLLVAARPHGSSKSVELLLKAGAEVNATNVFGATALMAAAASGDLDTVKVLVRHGADLNAHSRGSEPTVIWGGGRSPLGWATFRGDLAMTKFLIGAGAEVNSPEGFGSALSQAAWNDQTKVAEFLLAHGADVRQKDFMNEFTPLHWAAGSDRRSPALVELLLKNGAEVNAEGGAPVDAFMGVPQTPLLIASKRNETAITRTLLSGGATAKKSKIAPQETVSSDKEVNDQTLRAAIGSAIPPLQETATFSKGAYLRHSSKQDCVSCHQQYLPLTSFGFARSAGASIDATTQAEVLDMVRRDNTNLHEITAQATFHPEPGHGYGYALLAMASQDQPASLELDAMIHHLLVIQGPDGRWYNNLPRPPLQTSDVAPTALAIHALKKYGFPAKHKEIEQRIAHAREWLSKVDPENTEERAYQLLGLAWAGEAQEKLHSFARILVREQRSNGGWAQLDSLEPDAYATGLSLVALAEATCSQTDEYRRGLAFLLGTQAEDGTWHVRTRAYPFQPTMRSGYPYSRDSWISATGASWATMAISLYLQDRPLQVSAR